MNAMKKWMAAATVVEQTTLAKEAKTSRNYLYQLASGHRTAEAALAGRIEIAARKLRRASKNRLPKLTRADLSPTCHACPFAQKCLNFTPKATTKPIRKD